jgi:hypothetical protein
MKVSNLCDMSSFNSAGKKGSRKNSHEQTFVLCAGAFSVAIF